MKTLLKGVIEHEMSNPVVKALGSEYFIGLVDLGFEPESEEQLMRIKHAIGKQLLLLVRSKEINGGPFENVDSYSKEAFHGALHENDTFAMWNNFDRSFMKENGFRGTEMLELGMNIDTITTEFEEDSMLSHLYFMLFVWPEAEPERGLPIVLHIEEAVQSALTGTYSVKRGCDD